MSTLPDQFAQMGSELAAAKQELEWTRAVLAAVVKQRMPSKTFTVLLQDVLQAHCQLSLVYDEIGNYLKITVRG